MWREIKVGQLTNNISVTALSWSLDKITAPTTAPPVWWPTQCLLRDRFSSSIKWSRVLFIHFVSSLVSIQGDGGPAFIIGGGHENSPNQLSVRANTDRQSHSHLWDGWRLSSTWCVSLEGNTEETCVNNMQTHTERSGARHTVIHWPNNCDSDHISLYSDRCMEEYGIAILRQLWHTCSWRIQSITGSSRLRQYYNSSYLQ